jgi:sugar-specific transcriptional regulator TrmB
MDEAVINRLQVLGFSLYEAKAYVGLLRHGPQNGNEVAKSAGLPSSKVYATLERLASKGLVHSVRRDTTTQYVCVSPDELLHRLREDYEEPIHYLEKTLHTLAAFEPSAEVLTVAGLDAIRENSRYLVIDARTEIYISIWSDDVDHLAPELVAAAARGVPIFGMLYGEEPPVGAGTWLTHSYREIVSDRIGGRMLTVVADGKEALIAHIPRQGSPSAVRTRNPVLSLITREYLHHDIVLQRAQVAFGFDEWDRWWKADPDLRTIILRGRTGVDENDDATREEESR